MSKLGMGEALQKQELGKMNGGGAAKIEIEVYEDRPSVVKIEGSMKPRYIPRVKRDLTRAWLDWKRSEMRRLDSRGRVSKQVLL